jgi:hypothetical protein
MAFRSDPPHQFWMSLRNPSEHKKRRSNPVRRQQVEQSVRISFHTAFKGVPVSPSHRRVKGRDLKMFFNVEG